MRGYGVLVLMLSVALLVGCMPLGAPITGSGKVVTKEETIAGFDKLDVSDGFHVGLRQADAFSVLVRADDNMIEDVRVIKDGNTLKIGLEPGTSFNLRDVTLEADVTMPEFAGADLAGGSHLQGDVEAGDVSFKLSGGSHATLSGSAGDLTVDASGGSHAKLGGLAVVDANVAASGGSHATVNPSGTLNVDAGGGSHVRYVGRPTLGTIDKDGSSSVKQE